MRQLMRSIPSFKKHLNRYFYDRTDVTSTHISEESCNKLFDNEGNIASFYHRVANIHTLTVPGKINRTVS